MSSYMFCLFRVVRLVPAQNGPQWLLVWYFLHLFPLGLFLTATPSSKWNFTHVTKSVCSSLNRGSCFFCRITCRLGSRSRQSQKAHAKRTEWAQPSDLCLCYDFLIVSEMSASTECHEWEKKHRLPQLCSTDSKMPMLNTVVRNQNAPYNCYTREM